MGLLSVLISSIAAFLFYITGNLALMILAIIAAFGNFWSWGVMRNETQTAPKWITWINLLFTLIGIVLLITGVMISIELDLIH
jgi:prepilin signal peptidase PulO-like enzyme (type II secretory pathway)